MLLGIPEADQQHVVEHGDSTLRTERGGKMTENPDGVIATGEVFASYIDWRAEHPSDDIMTELLNAEFADETGATRRLGRDELLLYLQVIATAGSETTTRLIGWAGKVLAEHPDQRRDLVANRTLLPAAIEELLRFEPPAPHVSRYVTRDLEYYGQTVPEGSAMMLLVGAANRDPRRFGDDSEAVQHPPRTPPAPRLRCRHAFLPGQRAGPPGRTHRARRDPRPLPGVGGRPDRSRTQPDVDGARLGVDARSGVMTNHAASQTMRLLR